MIKENITAYVNSYVHEGEIIVPSVVLTSTPQEETIDLSLTPNFQIKVMDTYSYISNNGDIKVTFDLNSYNYTSYMYIVNSSQTGYVTLQSTGSYLNMKEVTPEPEVHTLRFSSTYLECSLDNYDGATVVTNDFTVLYDDENISIEQGMLQGMEHVYVTIKDDTITGFFTPNDRQEVGEYEDTVTIEYEDLTATCWVGCTITDSTPPPEQEPSE